MSMPSMTKKGSLSSTALSMNAPGSPSSALQMRYFCARGVWRAMFHFCPVGKPAPPSAAPPRRQHLAADLFRRHGANGLGGGSESPGRQRRVEDAGIDDARVAQHHLHLLLEEVGGVDLRDVRPRGAAIPVPAVEEAVAHLSTQEHRFEQLIDVAEVDVGV